MTAMLTLISDALRKKAAQETLERNLKNALESRGKHSIGFRGGNVDLTIYSAGPGKLWVAFGGPTGDAAARRSWNAFGMYLPDRPKQSIAVEINIPTDHNKAQIAGFFAEDAETGDIFLMHSGRLGGGRPGIGKSAFLIWSKAKLLRVAGEHGAVRSGIAIGKLDHPDLANRIGTFVRNVQSFKDQADEGALETPEFKQRMDEFHRYRKEFAGQKRGARSGAFEYVTYHGDIVQKLYDERTARLQPGEKVSNSNLIDLFVTKRGVLSEVYEVKTGLGRQMLYTAIGQVVTHAAAGNDKAAKFLIVPADDAIPEDLQRAIASLGIQVRRFRLEGTGNHRAVQLN